MGVERMAYIIFTCEALGAKKFHRVLPFTNLNRLCRAAEHKENRTEFHVIHCFKTLEMLISLI